MIDVPGFEPLVSKLGTVKEDSGPNAAGTTSHFERVSLRNLVGPCEAMANAGVEYMTTQVRILSRPEMV